MLNIHVSLMADTVKVTEVTLAPCYHHSNLIPFCHQMKTFPCSLHAFHLSFVSSYNISIGDQQGFSVFVGSCHANVHYQWQPNNGSHLVWAADWFCRFSGGQSRHIPTSVEPKTLHFHYSHTFLQSKQSPTWPFE